MKTWEEMSRNERKVAVAQDVLVNLNLKKLNVQRANGYVVTSDVADNVVIFEKAPTHKDIAEALKGNCSVCARGAMMLCKVASYGGYKFSNASVGGYDIGASGQTTKALEDTFTFIELRDIERKFEKGIQTLEQIMQSIIDNEGEVKLG